MPDPLDTIRRHVWMTPYLEEDLETCLRYEADRMVRGALTDDYVEAVAAFSEKRKPNFR